MHIIAHTWTTARIDDRHWSGSIPTSCPLSPKEWKCQTWRPLLRQSIISDTDRIADDITQRRIQSAVIHFDNGTFKELEADDLVIDLRPMIPYGYKLANNYTMTNQEIDRYNVTQKRINSFIEATRPIPEYELHDSWAQVAIHINA